MDQPALRAEGITKSYLTGKVSATVLHGLSVEARAGELTLICGPSGCGKSTLLAILSGLLRPDAGRVHALGRDLIRLDATALDRFRLEHTGFVFQGFNLFPALSALEQVLLPLDYVAIPRRAALARAHAALDEVGLAGAARLRPAELSGGEKQRVAIARALVKRPQLLFADEPTSSLDAANGQNVIEILHRAAHAHRATVLCVSHDARLMDHADRVLQMEDGRILREWRTEPAAEATPE